MSATEDRPRPLAGLRVVELPAIGPVPHAAMQFADLGAEVVRVERPGLVHRSPGTVRGRESIMLDLRTDAGAAELWSLIEKADVLLEGYRPGVMERLGFGPERVAERNPRLVFARLTGWGQDGPLAARAGHDINYLAITGVLHAIGPADHPVPPINLVGDFGGGSMPALVGVLAALWERERSGRGRVIDAAIVDGVSMLSTMVWSLRAENRWSDERGGNLFDGGAPFYTTYECADGRYVAVGAYEQQFYQILLMVLGLDPEQIPDRDDKAQWPALRDRLAQAFGSRSRDEWASAFAESDACVTPVLSFAEAVSHPHLTARGAFIDVDGQPMPAPAPRFDKATRPTRKAANV